MKVKLDENMPADLAIRLRQAGHDVADVVEEGLGGADDSPILKAATNEGRILMTFDLDFADIRHYPPGSHAGIVVFRLQDQRWQSMQGPVDRLLVGSSLEGLGNGLAIVDETRVRYKRAKKRTLSEDEHRRRAQEFGNESHGSTHAPPRHQHRR